MTYGVVLTALFWPPLIAVLLWRGYKTYALAATVAPFLILGTMCAMNQVDPDTPWFLALFVHGIVASRLIAEQFRAHDDD